MMVTATYSIIKWPDIWPWSVLTDKLPVDELAFVTVTAETRE